MRVITVARKPPKGTVAKNALEYGTGGIHIDRSRIGTGLRVNPPAANQPGGSSYNMSVVGMPTDALATQAQGRWPANVILNHLPGCRCVGVTKVGQGESKVNPATTHHLDGAVHEGYRSAGVSKYTTNVEGTVRQYGEEEVLNWECESGCPVPLLDEQVGHQKSGTSVRRHGVSESFLYGDGMGFCPPGTPDMGYEDEGGVSRFFKQVGGSTE